MKTTFNAKTLWALVLVAGIFGLGSAGAHTDPIQTVHIQQSRMTEAQKQAYDMPTQTIQTVVIVGYRSMLNT